MTDAQSLFHTTLVLKVFERLMRDHPKMTLSAAEPIMRAAIKLALAEIPSNRSFDQAVCMIFADASVAELTPPWDG